MEISTALVENIGEEELKRYLKDKGITPNSTGQDIRHRISDLIGGEISKEEFEEYCYKMLMYGKRKLIRSYGISNTRVLRDEMKWLDSLGREFHIKSLNFNNILTCNLQNGDEWKIAAIEQKDDETGDVERIYILLQCYVCKMGSIPSCTYIPVEINLKQKVMLVRAWRRQGLESDEEYKYNFLMDKAVDWFINNIGIEIKKMHLKYKRTLANMNESLIDELIQAIPTSRDVQLLKAYFPKVQAAILKEVGFEHKYIEGTEVLLPDNIINIEKELKNLVTRAIVSDYFFSRNYDEVWNMGLSAIINSVKLSELDSSITIVKSENNTKPIFCSKPFLMLLSAMENSKQVDTLSITFLLRNKRFRVTYDATEEEYIGIGILSGQTDFSEDDYEVIWEMLKKYEKGKIKPITRMGETASGE